MVDERVEELQLLSALFAAPTAESLTLLREEAAPYYWLQPALDELTQWPLDHWQAEHTRLFINGYPDTPCIPFASHWRHGCMQGPVVDELADLFHRIGVASDGMPNDYLGVLLEVAALLDGERPPGYEVLLQELWSMHLQPWLPRMAAALREHSRLQLYRTLGIRLQALCDECY